MQISIKIINRNVNKIAPQYLFVIISRTVAVSNGQAPAGIFMPGVALWP
jgi:hypothetical protein